MFYVADPSVWNSLPVDVQLCPTVLTFKLHLESCLSHSSGVVLTALVTSAKLSYVESGLYWDCWLLDGLPSGIFQTTQAHSAWPFPHG